MSNFFTPLPEILSSEIKYEGFFRIRVDHLKLPHGPEMHYTILKTDCDAVAVIAETENNHLVILSEYRHPTGEWLLGCAGGRLDIGESPLAAASRELLEETGYLSQDLYIMSTLYPFPAVCDQKIHFVLAKNARFVQPPNHETFEVIEVKLKTKEEIFKDIRMGTPTDGILCTALMLREINFDF